MHRGEAWSQVDRPDGADFRRHAATSILLVLRPGARRRRKACTRQERGRKFFEMSWCRPFLEAIHPETYIPLKFLYVDSHSGTTGRLM